jgi:hypothetical protein
MSLEANSSDAPSTLGFEDGSAYDYTTTDFDRAYGY